MDGSVITSGQDLRFESFVNSDRCKTITESKKTTIGLRALLIQAGVKHVKHLKRGYISLRALLIQTGVKLGVRYSVILWCLRALLIQTGVKQ